ncbi:MAG: nucleoside-triphosphatase [Anaerolineae bacterium]
MLLLLTGEVGSGKTTVCQRVVEGCRPLGIPVAGLLSLPLIGPQGQRLAIQAVDLTTGARERLARLGEGEGTRLGPYTFAPEAVRWALAVLERDVAAPGLLLVDEIGPLELGRGEGLAPALPALQRRAEEGKPLLLVVRTGFIAPLLRAVAPLTCPVATFRVTARTRDLLPQWILAALECEGVPEAPGRNRLSPWTSEQVHEAGKEPFGAGRQAVA